MALIGVVALIVIGPEKLPKVARTLGALIGKDLEELKKMKESMESAARDVEQTVQTTASDFEKDWAETTAGLTHDLPELETPPPIYKNPDKNWRLKRGAVPQWYKARAGVRTKALSGAARVARYRPKSFHSQ